MTIGGHNLGHATRVLFGMQGTSLRVVSSRKIIVHSPAHAAGRVHLRVVSFYGTSPAVTADRYKFT